MIHFHDHPPSGAGRGVESGIANSCLRNNFQNLCYVPILGKAKLPARRDAGEMLTSASNSVTKMVLKICAQFVLMQFYTYFRFFWVWVGDCPSPTLDFVTKIV